MHQLLIILSAFVDLLNLIPIAKEKAFQTDYCQRFSQCIFYCLFGWSRGRLNILVPASYLKKAALGPATLQLSATPQKIMLTLQCTGTYVFQSDTYMPCQLFFRAFKLVRERHFLTVDELCRLLTEEEDIADITAHIVYLRRGQGLPSIFWASLKHVYLDSDEDLCVSQLLPLASNLRKTWVKR